MFESLPLLWRRVTGVAALQVTGQKQHLLRHIKPRWATLTVTSIDLRSPGSN